MKCKHCEKVWSIAHHNSIPSNCPFCGESLQFVCENARSDASAADVVSMFVRTYGEDILQNRKLFLALMGDLAPHLKKERKIFSTAMTNDVMKLFEVCPEQEQIKRIGRIRSMLDVLSEDAISLFISSIGQSVGWTMQPAAPEKQTAEQKPLTQTSTQGYQVSFDAEQRPLPQTSTQGYQVSLNPEETVEQKAHRGDKDAIMMMVKQCSDAGDIRSAVEWAKKGAAAGIVKAAHLLGVCYHEGLGTQENKQESERWLKFAAEHGSTDAAAYLGKALMKTNRPNDAERWLLQAAQAGHVQSMHFLAHVYRDQKKTQDALVWAQKAFEGGDMDSTVMCAALLCDINTKESIQKALQYCNQFMAWAKKDHPLYQSVEQFINQLREQEKKFNQPKPVPKPTIPRKKALESVLRSYYNEFTSYPTAYFKNSDEYVLNPDYRKKADKKLKGALKSYAQGAANEQIYVWVDDTLFGGARDGFVLTDAHLYGKSIGDKPIDPVPIDSITDIRLDKTGGMNRIYVYYTKQNSTWEYKSFLISIGNPKDQEALRKAGKMISMLKNFVQKSQEYKEKAEPSPDQKAANAKLWQAIQPYVETLYGIDENVCVYSKKSRHYYNDETYRIITDDLLREGIKNLTKVRQNMLNNEEILVFTSIGSSGFILTENTFYTPNGAVDAEIITDFRILETSYLSVLRAFYKTSDGKQHELILHMVLAPELDRLQKIQEMLEAFLKAKKSA